MANARSPSLLARWTRGRKAAKPRLPEPAEMGTAYGMECTLEQRLVARDGPTISTAAEPNWLARWWAGKSGA